MDTTKRIEMKLQSLRLANSSPYSNMEIYSDITCYQKDPSKNRMLIPQRRNLYCCVYFDIFAGIEPKIGNLGCELEMDGLGLQTAVVFRGSEYVFIDKPPGTVNLQRRVNRQMVR